MIRKNPSIFTKLPRNQDECHGEDGTKYTRAVAACSAGAACARFDARISTRGAVVFRHGLGEKKRKKMGKTWEHWRKNLGKIWEAWNH